jgi:isoleucyl-tRNA synthetase
VSIVQAAFIIIISTNVFLNISFRDGKKMSKSLKNYPDPVLVINNFGADAVRWVLQSPLMLFAYVSLSSR